MDVFLLKLTLMPIVVALVTLVSRKWGNKIGGLIGSMPWTAGPILLFFILEQGKAFGVQAVQGTMTGILALVCFCYTYSYLCRTQPWLPTLLLAYAVYAIIALLVNYLQLNLILSYVLVIIAVRLALQFLPVPAEQVSSSRRMRFEIPVRMLVTTLFVVAITGLAGLLGPGWSGILTPFPIMTSILAIFSHMLQGGNATIATLRGLLIGLFGFTTFLFLQAFLLPQFSVAVAFAIAFLINAFINVVASRIW